MSPYICYYGVQKSILKEGGEGEGPELAWAGQCPAPSPRSSLLSPLSALSALAAPPPAPAQTRSLSPDPAPVKDFPINCAQRSRR